MRASRALAEAWRSIWQGPTIRIFYDKNYFSSLLSWLLAKSVEDIEVIVLLKTEGCFCAVRAP
jgi:hypothetical protein